jgi:glycosyltransferase involved in cell wall biosynthesis
MPAIIGKISYYCPYMRIAVNTRFLLKGKLEGIGVFTHESLQRITRAHPEHEFIFIFDRPYHPSFIYSSNIIPVVIPPPARHPLLWYLWFEWALPRVLRKYKPDVLLSPDGYLSLSSNVPTLLVLHDLAFEHYPEYVPGLVGKYYKHYTPKFAQYAKRIATVSEYTKRDVMQLYGIAPTKIDVVYNGIKDVYKPLAASAQQAVRDEYTNGAPYLVYVGSIHPRKNLVRLFQAFDAYKQQTNSPDKLVIIGAKGWQYGDIMTTYNAMTHKAEVVFLGHLEAEQVASLVASARAMAYVSIFEGFGIPIVEAFASGTPVITSNTSSMPEVAGDAALLVDPTSVEEITAAMCQLYQQLETAEALRQRASVQLQKFSWEQTAQKLWASLMKTV